MVAPEDHNTQATPGSIIPVYSALAAAECRSARFQTPRDLSAISHAPREGKTRQQNNMGET